MAGTVLFIGAGATASVNGPTTDQILPALYSQRARIAASDATRKVDKLVKFLEDEFHIQTDSNKEHYPGLPLLMSLMDMALERREQLSPQWDVDVVQELRQAIELGIFDVLEEALNRFPTNNHYTLFETLFPKPKIPNIISTNYDLVADTALMSLSQQRTSDGGLPDYHCGIANLLPLTPDQKFGTLLKLHGSLNWLYCRTCQRLVLGATDSTRYLKSLQKIAGPDLRSSLMADGAPCEVCDYKLRPLLIAPSHLKDYRNPHLGQVWYEAQHVLREADRAVFVGYSLPDDDLEVVYLLKRSLAHIDDPKRITVIEYCQENTNIALKDHPVGRRYRAIFGEVDWHASGLDSWLSQQTQAVIPPV